MALSVSGNVYLNDLDSRQMCLAWRFELKHQGTLYFKWGLPSAPKVKPEDLGHVEITWSTVEGLDLIRELIIKITTSRVLA